MYTATPQPINRKALLFGLSSVLLYGIGFGLTAPVLPFLVEPYISSPDQQATTIAFLTFIYAFCVILTAPMLGALSDRFGRKPVLTLCLIGSALGYLIFGIGGALWVLFLGRIIDGLTGGNISTLFAYFADITPHEDRVKYFGWAGAASGIGFIIGPSLGGLLAHYGNVVPMYFGAAVTLLNVLYGLLFMPETLTPQRRLKSISSAQLNPLTQFSGLWQMAGLRPVFMAIFLVGIPAGALQAFYAQFAKDSFLWQPTFIGMAFSVLGATDILTQSFVMPILLKRLTDKHLALLGMSSELCAYGLIALSGMMNLPVLFMLGTLTYGFGDAIWSPAINGIASKTATPETQGRIQGGSQSVQALTRIIGPLVGGMLYLSLAHYAPALMGVGLVACAIYVLSKSLQTKR